VSAIRHRTLSALWTFTGAGPRCYRKAVGYDDATWRPRLRLGTRTIADGIEYYRHTLPRMAEHGAAWSAQ